jgi:hypothetical protein
MDGRVLSDILTSQYAPAASTMHAESVGDSVAIHTAVEPVGQAAASNYSEDDEAVIAERLRALGYIE